ncbi:MAG: LolA family protein [Candidatus Nanopelagicales bacterium]
MRNITSWLVPVGVVAALGVGSLINSAAADAPPDVPALTAQQVLAKVAASEVDAFSGTVVTRTDLGLPSLSELTGSSPHASVKDAASMVTRLLTGATELRVARSGASQSRVTVLDDFSEFAVIRNGSTLWTYASRPNEAHKIALPAEAKVHGTAPTQLADLTPDQLAAQAIAGMDAKTALTVGTPEKVAGRATYPLTLTPRTDQTQVGSIEIAVDAEYGTPLRFQVFPRGSNAPAISAGFTSVDFAAPAPGTFEFAAPPGATVTEGTIPEKGAESGREHPASTPQTTGSGWATILEFPVGEDTRELLARATGEQAALLGQLATPVAGGLALRTTLGSALITDDGRILIGSVAVEALAAAAGK